MSVWIESGFQGNEYPLNHGRVCWQWYGGTVTSTSEASGFADDNALPPRTDSAWRASSLPATWTITFSEAKAFSFLGIAKHNLGTQNATITIEYNDGTGWASIAGFSGVEVPDDAPILALCAERSATAVRVTVDSADAAPTISVIMAGTADEWPRPFTWTGQPITEGDQIQFDNNRSLTGNFLGRSKRSDGLSFDLTMQNASEAWRVGDFAAFKDYANGGDAVFFVAARPFDYPNELAFAWCPNIIRADRETPNKRISTTVTLQCQGLRTYG